MRAFEVAYGRAPSDDERQAVLDATGEARGALALRQYEKNPRDMPPGLISLSSELSLLRDQYWKDIERMMTPPPDTDAAIE